MGEQLEDRNLLAVTMFPIFSEAAGENPDIVGQVSAAFQQIAPLLTFFTDVVDQRQGEASDDIFIPIVIDIIDLEDPLLFQPQFRGNQADYGFVRDALIRDASDEPDDAIVGALPLPNQLQVEARYPFFWNKQIIVTKTQLRALSAWPPVLDLQYEPFVIDDTLVLADMGLFFDSDFDGENFLPSITAALLQNLGFSSAVTSIPTNPGLFINGLVPIPTADLFRFADNLPGKDPSNIAEFQTFPRSISPSVPGVYDDISLESRLTGIFEIDLLIIARVLDLVGWDVNTNLFPPSANDDNVTVQEDTPTLIDILGNDEDIDGQLIVGSLLITKQPDFGTLSVDLVNGVVLYTPFANYNGPDNFVYSISDNDFARDTATVNITVVSVNDLPAARNDSVAVAIDEATLIAILANDGDIDGTLNPASVQIITQATNGVALALPSGQIQYTPNPGFFGGDLIEYRVRDNAGGLSNTARVMIRVGNPVQLSGKVYSDFNNNGVQDPGEPGIPNVNVALSKTDGAYTFSGLIATTDSNGNYLFSEVDGGPVLPAGRYTIAEIHPQAFFDGIDTPGAPAPLDPPTNDAFGGIVLNPGGAAVGFNFGEGGLRSEALTAGLGNRFFLATDAAPFVMSFIVSGTTSGDGSSATFIANLYQEVLNRPVDPFGLSFWTNQIDTLGMSRSQVVNIFLNSPEYRSNLINAYFQRYLGRSIDLWGLGQFFAVMDAGWSQEDVLALILRSDEYYAKHGSNFNNFVQSLYADMLGRTASAGELNLVKNSPRQAVVDMVLASDELGRLLLDGTAAQGGWYDRYLGRNADTHGVNSFLSLLRAGWTWRDVQAFLLASDENFF